MLFVHVSKYNRWYVYVLLSFLQKKFWEKLTYKIWFDPYNSKYDTNNSYVQKRHNAIFTLHSFANISNRNFNER